MKIGFIGLGNMAQAMIGGILKEGDLWICEDSRNRKEDQRKI